MKYRIELAATAKLDIRVQAQGLRDNVSPAASNKWLTGLNKAIATLQTRPLRCPLAAENDRFPEDIHVLMYGKKSNTHQIIFTIRLNVVYVLYVRHTARDELEP